MVVRTKFREGADNFGEEFFRAERKRYEATLILKLFIVIAKQGFYSGGF
jgi:hypothetical protein